MGEASAAIFEVHQMMLEDDDYNESIENIIRTQEVNAEYAVASTGDNFSEMFASMDDDYMRARAADIKDISERLVRNLSGQSGMDTEFEEPVIVMADDLTPSETVQMDKEKILAFVTVHGSTNSHTAILARMMNIPALIGVDMNLEEIQSGTCAVVDGFTGEFILDPDENVQEAAKAKIAAEEEKKNLLLKLKGKENVTKSGKKSISMPISEALEIWAMCWKTMREELDFSEVSSFISAEMSFLRRKNSFRHISRQCRIWQERRSLSVRWISAQISRLTILI